MVKETEGWRFDMAAAPNEILTRTIMNFLPYRPCTLTSMRNRSIACKTIAGRTR